MDTSHRYNPTFIRDWRKARGLSLRELANILGATEDGEPLISHASIARIEKGQQPYSQPIVEAIAAALGVTVSMLLQSPPGAALDLLDLVGRIKDEDRDAVRRMLEAFAAPQE